MNRLVALGMAWLLLVSGGCTKHAARADVDVGLIIPRGGQVEMPENQQFLFPTPVFENPLPEYPSEHLADGLDEQVVCLQILIDEGGSVAWSTAFDGPAGCPSAEQPALPAFTRSARKAVADWQFLAAAVCTYPEGRPKNEDCSGEGVEMRPLAVKLSYRFRFGWREGRPSVEH
ncbi:MAG TPA: hypothetical protein VFY00_00815 [Arenimonas sp.]|nr:hypothetical protein [Arenimonas sp.]